jgi:hypothetical protein
MRHSLLAVVVAALVNPFEVLGAQAALSAVTAVRLTYQRVDKVALDFGVDTAAMRQDTERRLARHGIAVGDGAALPELVVSIRVPKQLAPADDGYARVEVALVATSARPMGRALWSSSAPSFRFTTFGSLRTLVPEHLEQQVDALLSARSSTAPRLAPGEQGL